MVLMDSVSNLFAPDCRTPNLIRTTIPFNDEKVTEFQTMALKFAIE